MTLIKGETGIYRGLFRRSKPPMQPLHLSLRTEKKAVASARHDAVQRCVREQRDALLEQLRAGVLSVERLTAMVASNEPLVPLAPPAPVADAASARTSSDCSRWETVDDAAERYLAWMRVHPNRSEQTATLAGFQIQRFRDFMYEGTRIGDQPVDRIPSAAVQAYQRTMLEAETSPNTVTTYMGRVSTLWSWAIEIEQREAREQRRPARELYSPVVPELLYRKKRPRERVLTVEEADRLLASTPRQLLWFVGCGLLAGLRAGETLHLRPGLDVDLEEGTISIRVQPGWRPKTERSRRVVPMAPSLWAIARVHAESYANESWMMPSPVDSTLPVTDLGVRTHFKAVVERAGMVYGRDKKHGVTYHTLRHSFASHAVMRGVDLYTVAKLLGDSLKTVEDVYADLSPDFKRTAVAKLAGAFSLPDFSQTDTHSVTGDAN